MTRYEEKHAFTNNQGQNIWPKTKKIGQKCTRPENFISSFA